MTKLGRQEGRFRELRLAASGNDVFVNDFIVTFGNGREQEIDQVDRINDSESSEPLDLKGRLRFIRKVELRARARRNFRGKAIICLAGTD